MSPTRSQRDRHQQLRRHRDRPRVLQADPQLELRRGHQAGDDQLPHAQAREGRPLLRAHLRSDQGLGVLLRQVQARPLQGHRLRALRRRGHALQGAPRAHGPHRPRRAGQPHLVLQGRPEPHRLPARHGAEGAREGPLLRRVDRHLGRRRGARARPRQAREGGQRRSSTPTPPSARSACSSCASRSSAARPTSRPASRPASPTTTTCGRTRSTSTSRSSTAEDRDKQLKELRKTFEADIADTEAYIEDAAERLRQVWELFQTMEPKQIEHDETLFRELKERFGSSVRLRRVLPRRHGRRGDPRPAPAGRPRGRARSSCADQVQNAKGQKQARAVKRLKVVSAFIQSGNKPGDDGPRRRAGDPAGAAPDGPARRRPLRDLATSTTSTAASSTATTASSGCSTSARPRSSSTTRSACSRRPSTRCSTTAAAAARSPARATAR